MRSQVRVLLSPPKKKTTPKGVVFLFWWKQDSNPSNARLRWSLARCGLDRSDTIISSSPVVSTARRAEDWADSPWGGAVEKEDYPSVSFANSSPHKGSLGRCRASGGFWVRRWTGGFFVLLRSGPSSVTAFAVPPSPQGEGVGAGRIRRGVVRGWEVVLRQSLSQLR